MARAETRPKSRPAPRERTNQKLRTRAALVTAARELVAVGKLPSVAEVAEAALVSLATAYRYFPDRMALLAEAAHELPPEIRERFRPVVDPALPLPERVEVATGKLLRIMLEREQLIRALIALSMQQSIEGPLAPNVRASRPSFRVAWFDEALRSEEKHLGPAELRKLKLALFALVSPESVFMLKDQFGLTYDEAVDVCSEGARGLVEATLARRERRGRRR